MTEGMLLTNEYNSSFPGNKSVFTNEINFLVFCTCLQIVPGTKSLLLIIPLLRIVLSSQYNNIEAAGVEVNNAFDPHASSSAVELDKLESKLKPSMPSSDILSDGFGLTSLHRKATRIKPTEVRTPNTSARSNDGVIESNANAFNKIKNREVSPRLKVIRAAGLNDLSTL